MSISQVGLNPNATPFYPPGYLQPPDPRLSRLEDCENIKNRLHNFTRRLISVSLTRRPCNFPFLIIINDKKKNIPLFLINEMLKASKSSSQRYFVEEHNNMTHFYV